MPRYEFQCSTCGEVAEVSRTMEHRTDPLYCDGTSAFDDPSAALTGDPKNHEATEMTRIMSRLAVARVAGKRYV